MTRALHSLADALYAAAHVVEWLAQQVHRAAHRRSIANLPTARPGNRPRAIP